jgi:hypothetical protein
MKIIILLSSVLFLLLVAVDNSRQDVLLKPQTNNPNVVTLYSDYYANERALRGTFNSQSPHDILDSYNQAMATLVLTLGSASSTEQIFKMGLSVPSVGLSLLSSLPSSFLYTAEPDIQIISLYKKHSEYIGNYKHSAAMLGSPYKLLGALGNNGRTFDCIIQDVFDQDMITDVNTIGQMVAVASNPDAFYIRHFNVDLVQHDSGAGSSVTALTVAQQMKASASFSGIMPRIVVLQQSASHYFIVASPSTRCRDLPPLSQMGLSSCVDVS